MKRLLVLGLLFIGIGTLLAKAPKYTKVDIVIDGNRVPTYSHKKNTYIEAVKGKEYSIRLSNLIGERIAVALSVDGLNTIDAKKTKPGKASKWVIGPYQTIVISGWQVSDRKARRFFFTSEDNSYAAKMGNTENLGIISAAFFKERKLQIRPQTMPPLWVPSMSGGLGGGGTGGGYGGGMGGMGGAGMPPAAPGSSQNETPKADTGKDSSEASEPEYAATGMGDKMDHEVESVNMILEKKPFETINIRYEFRDALVKLKVPLDRPEEEPLLRRQKAKGYDDKNFCPEP